MPGGSGSSGNGGLLSTVTSYEQVTAVNGTTLELTPTQTSVGVTTSGGTASVQLPDPGRMKGQVVSVWTENQSAGNLTVILPGTGGANLTPTADADYVVAWSDGVHWFVISSLIT
jgi:hypothetical protein